MKRRVLIVSYYFPPLGLAGVTRPLQLFSRLASHGYECHVLTVKPVAYYANEPELLDGLDVTRIHRSGSRDPQRIMYLFGKRSISEKSAAANRLIKSSMFPDSKRGWIGPAVRCGIKLVRQHEIDILLSTSPPVSCHVVASRIAAETSVKWVADFRDLWTTEPIDDTYSSTDMIERGRRLLSEIREGATAVTAVNRSVAEYVGTEHFITNGYDANDASLWNSEPERSRFVIGLLGTFNELLPVEPLLRCLRVMREKAPSAFERIRLLQVGRVNKVWLLSQLVQFGLADSCEMLGLQPRKNSISLLNAASLFYLGVKPGWGDRITTARIYDLLASGRPILAYANQASEIGHLLGDATNNMTFTEGNTAEAAEFIANIVTRHEHQQLNFQPIPEYARPYSWDNVAAQFAALFGRVI